MRTIPKLAKLLRLLIAVCDVIAIAGPKIREYVPEGSKTDYDNALSAILGACDILRAIDYIDAWPGTNPPFGSAYD
jgi:hypothetical protein